MDEVTRSKLQAASQRISAVLDAQFSRISVPGMERELVGAELVEDPVPGLIFRVRHWTVPDGRVLDIFAPAYAANEFELGVLENPYPEDDVDDVDADSGDLDLIDVYIIERLETGGFHGRWSEYASGRLFVNLYDDSFLPR